MESDDRPPPVRIRASVLAELAGGARACARTLGLTHTAVEHWIKRNDVVPCSSMRNVMRHYRHLFPREYHQWLIEVGEEDPHQPDLFDDL